MWRGKFLIPIFWVSAATTGNFIWIEFDADVATTSSSTVFSIKLDALDVLSKKWLEIEIAICCSDVCKFTNSAMRRILSKEISSIERFCY